MKWNGRNILLPLLRAKKQKNRIQRFLARVCGKGNRIWMPETDYYRLLKVLREYRNTGQVKRNILDTIEQLLGKASGLALRRVPRDLVTMNSRFVVLTPAGLSRVLSLVYPDEVNKVEGRISILSWLGMCLLGRREGDCIRKKLYIAKVVYQPEAHDDFHL